MSGSRAPRGPLAPVGVHGRERRRQLDLGEHHAQRGRQPLHLLAGAGEGGLTGGPAGGGGVFFVWFLYGGGEGVFLGLWVRELRGMGILVHATRQVTHTVRSISFTSVSCLRSVILRVRGLLDKGGKSLRHHIFFPTDFFAQDW